MSKRSKSKPKDKRRAAFKAKQEAEPLPFDWYDIACYSGPSYTAVERAYDLSTSRCGKCGWSHRAMFGDRLLCLRCLAWSEPLVNPPPGVWVYRPRSRLEKFQSLY